MQCLRCGRGTVDGHVFCPECQEEMRRHPVKPNTVVTIPERAVRMRNNAPKKQHQKQEEEDVLQLHRTILQLRLWVCMLMAALMLCVGVLTWQELTRANEPAIGQNYSSTVDPNDDGP